MNKDDALVQLARLSLSGRRQDVQMYIARIARNKEFATIQKDLAEIIHESPTPKSPLRSTSSYSAPVDAESRLPLTRLRQFPDLKIQPIWQDSVAREMKQIIQERQQGKKLTSVGLAPVRTILFTGPPGVGKTLSAHWCAQQLELPLLILDLSTVMSSYLGRTGMNLRNVLHYAKNTQCVMLLDEIDAIAKSRSDTTEIGELKRLVNILLQEIDDWSTNNLLIAATNHPDLLDSAVWRRFERIIRFELPDIRQVEQAVREFLGPALNNTRPETLDALVFALEGKSYSDIEDCCMNIRKQALLNKEKIDEVVKQQLVEQTLLMDKIKRKRCVLHLYKLGYSQRKSSELTGVNRATIRKMVAHESQ